MMLAPRIGKMRRRFSYQHRSLMRAQSAAGVVFVCAARTETDQHHMVNRQQTHIHTHAHTPICFVDVVSLACLTFACASADSRNYRLWCYCIRFFRSFMFVFVFTFEWNERYNGNRNNIKTGSIYSLEMQMSSFNQLCRNRYDLSSTDIRMCESVDISNQIIANLYSYLSYPELWNTHRSTPRF